MNQTVVITEWVKQAVGRRDILELPHFPIAGQLEKYDAAGTGIGFVLVLSITSTSDIDGDAPMDPETTYFNLNSLPVVKIRGEWVTVADENLADILAGIVRLVVPPIEVPNDGEQSESQAAPDASRQ